MKKILHIIPSLNLGGEEKFLLDIYPFLSKKFNHIICPFFHIGELYPETKTMQLEKSKNSAFWVYIFKSRTMLAKTLKPLLFFYYFYRILLFLKKENPSAILTYSTAPDLFLGLFDVFSIRKRKYKWYSRICFQTDRIMFFPSFSYNKKNSSLHKKIIYHALLSIMHFHIKLFVKRADCVIVINDFTKNEVSRLCKSDISKFFLIPVCLPASNFSNKSSVIEEKTPFFIAAGRLERVKGFDFLIKVFAHFIKTTPEAKLIIFGEGSERQSLEKLIRSLNLSEKVMLPGYVKNPAKIGKNAIAYIVPSRSEAFGKIIIEAMEAQSIVISSDCTGPREIITHNVNGLLFESENNNSLLKAMNDAMALSEESKSKVKENAYQKSLVYQPEHVATLLNLKLETECI